MPKPQVQVPHIEVKGTKRKYLMIDDYPHELRDLRLQVPFAHCYTKKNTSAKTPILSGTGRWIIFHKDYSWDGASGPAIDTLNTRRASLVHDGLYQAMRIGRLSRELKGAADDEMLRILREDGMSWVRRLLWRIGLRFAGGATRPEEGEKYYPCPSGPHTQAGGGHNRSHGPLT